jgi:two-component system, cell cycle response regulator
MPNPEILTELYRCTQAIGLRDDFEGLLQTVLGKGQKLIGFEHAALMLHDEEEGVLEVNCIIGYGDRREEFLGMTLPLGQGISGWAATHRQSVRVGNVARDPRYIEGLREAQSNMAVPLVVGNEVAGVINVESPRPNAFTEEHEKLLTVLGAQAALAIAAHRANQKLQERIVQLNALYQVSQLATNRENFDDILTEILRIAETVLPEGRGAILLIDSDSGKLRLAASIGYREEVQDLEIAIGEGVTGRAAESGKVVVVDDLSQEADYIPGVSGALSEIAIPLTVKGSVIGILNSESVRPKAYSKANIPTLSLIAQQAAVVLRTARLHEETRRLASTDHLTGLWNRRHLLEQLELNLSRARRFKEQLAVVFIDLDHFKDINDRYGHSVGDATLERIGRALGESIREPDLIGRMGGEEFAVILIQCGWERAFQVAERLRQEVKNLRIKPRDEYDVRLSLSAGISVFPDDASTMENLFRQADAALYEAKTQGRDRVVLARGLGGETSGDGRRVDQS